MQATKRISATQRVGESWGWIKAARGIVTQLGWKRTPGVSETANAFQSWL